MKSSVSKKKDLINKDNYCSAMLRTSIMYQNCAILHWNSKIDKFIRQKKINDYRRLYE